MENTSNNPPAQDSGASQPEEMKIESTIRKVKVKTINNLVYNLEVSPTVITILFPNFFLLIFFIDPHQRLQKRN